MKMRYSFVHLAALIGTFVGLSNAHAAYPTAYPGVTCHNNGGGSYVTWYGTVYNGSGSGELNVICPAIKQHTNVASATLQLYDRNSTVNVSCTLVNEYVTSSGAYNWSNTQTSSGYGSAYMNLTFSGLGSSGGGTDHYYFNCTVPRAENGNVSHIVGYTINES